MSLGLFLTLLLFVAVLTISLGAMVVAIRDWRADRRLRRLRGER